MNENIDLTKILKDCPKGWKFWSPIFGEVDFKEIRSNDEYAITITDGICIYTFTEEGFYRGDVDGKCTLFPSKDQRDWSKFTAPWYKKEKFDPKTLKPFDKVLVRDGCTEDWQCGFFSHINNDYRLYSYVTTEGFLAYCIPYNDNTKHLVGTMDEAPDYYRYWEEMKNI